MTVVGRVVALRRYPVKSMAAEELDGAEVSWHGVAGDRRWAFIRDGQVRSGFPWLTIRERPEMARYRPFYAERARPNAAATLVRTPNLLVDAAGRGFAEDAWVGRVLRIGGLRMRVDLRDQRCVMVTIDPVTLHRDPAILRAIARERDNRLGVYGSTVAPGRVAVGDPVRARTLSRLSFGYGGATWVSFPRGPGCPVPSARYR